jgi:hypothetical protein
MVMMAPAVLFLLLFRKLIIRYGYKMKFCLKVEIVEFVIQILHMEVGLASEVEAFVTWGGLGRSVATPTGPSPCNPACQSRGIY